MPRGDKSSYTDKQKRQAQHIEKGYRKRGVSEDEAERRAWATVNKETGGGNKSGSGRGKPDTKVSSRRGGRIGGKAAAARPAAARSASAKKAAATRARRASGTSSTRSKSTRSGTASRSTTTRRSSSASMRASSRRSTTTRSGGAGKSGASRRGRVAKKR
jgi:plasmid stabilization system protein ParE